MGAIDVGIRHDNDLLIPGLVELERAARTRADDLDDRGTLGVREHVCDRGLLDVENLAADRQKRLELGGTRQPRGTERGVTLDDEQLGAVDFLGAAVQELSRQSR